MKIILETQRLFLRELNLNDAQDFYNLNANLNVIKYTGNSAFEDVEQARNFLCNYKDYEENGFGRWAVLEKIGGEFLGWCGLKYNKEIDETDIGFRFFENKWNRGFASESAKACIDYGFQKLNLHKIVGRAMAENTASIKVLQKIGLTFDKEFDFNGNRGVVYTIEK